MLKFIFKIKNFFKQLFCKHDWRCLNEDCNYRKPNRCGDIELISGYGYC